MRILLSITRAMGFRPIDHVSSIAHGMNGLHRLPEFFAMSRLPNFKSQRFNIGQSLGGGLFLIGAIWLGLVARDYALNVLVADATPGSSESFYQTATLVSVSAAAVFVGAGVLLFWKSRKGRLLHHSEHRRRVRTSRSARPMPLVQRTALAPDADDETVSLDSVDGVLAAGDPGTGRAKQRVRVRVRLPKEPEK